MRPRTVRWIVIAVSVAGIAGMIVGSVADNNGMAITFGLIAAVAVLGLILVTSVVGPEGFGAERPPSGVSEADAAELEERISVLVEAGADEDAVRGLVRTAVRLGRASGGEPHSR